MFKKVVSKPRHFNIVGLEELVFSVSDLETSAKYLLDYGLTPVVDARGRKRFEGADGTAVSLSHPSSEPLPEIGPNIALRQVVFGVGDKSTLAGIVSELKTDRAVHVTRDGTVETTDDLGFNIAFRITQRRALLPSLPRPVNGVATEPDMPTVPQTLSHIVLLVPDVPKAEAFYTQRLGFRVSDRYQNTGPFLRAPGSRDHHCLFLIEVPPHVKGVDHFTFHMRSVMEVFMAGHRFSAKGHQTHWGPGRHYLGSNWFWYFNSPFNCAIEYDADMDQHDDDWVARELPVTADTLQLFLFNERPKWNPSSEGK